jgi:O-acetyl-ADP-ribose deacetylase (regulator of RNase III)
MDQGEARLWLIQKLKSENPVYSKVPVPADEQGQKDLLRILMNVRMPKPIGSEFREVQDAYLRREAMLKGIVDADSLEGCRLDPRICLWQGDITRLKADAIVNAANSGMTGCYTPLHNCIDNCIHTAAGLDLRWECYRIMQKQGHEEPTGMAKITPGYCLPAKYVLHTVGPIVSGGLTEEHKELLRSCYVSCLDLASENGLSNVAFCCISTGVFAFPADRAAEIAVQTVRSWLDSHSGSSVKRVIFNVFGDRDKAIYQSILN